MNGVQRQNLLCAALCFVGFDCRLASQAVQLRGAYLKLKITVGVWQVLKNTFVYIVSDLSIHTDTDLQTPYQRHSLF